MFLADWHEIMITRRWLHFLMFRNYIYQNTDLQQNKRTFFFIPGLGGQLALVQGQSILSSFAGP